MSAFDLDRLLAMKHSPVKNYAIPGLTSWLIGESSPKGCVRLFECSREHQEAITPHSHRFDFQCWVLSGWVRNRIWMRTYTASDWFMVSKQTKGRMGGYETVEEGSNRFTHSDKTYAAGEWYGMTHREIHSIYFGRDTKVLFFEGPEQTNETRILEPFVGGKKVPTFKVEDWMFESEALA